MITSEKWRSWEGKLLYFIYICVSYFIPFCSSWKFISIHITSVIYVKKPVVIACGVCEFASKNKLSNQCYFLLYSFFSLCSQFLCTHENTKPYCLWGIIVSDSDSIPEEGTGNPPQYSCLENPMDRGTWQATVHGVAKNRTRLSDCHTFIWQYCFRK